MGDPRKLKRKFETPKMIWSAERIENEKALLEEYGLKNMRELWVMLKELKRVRREARRLLSLGEDGRRSGKALIDRLVRLGIAKEGTTLEGLLALSIRDIMDRRLQTLVFKKGIGKSMLDARKMIAHGHVAIKGRKVSAPSYIVNLRDEKEIGIYRGG